MPLVEHHTSGHASVFDLRRMVLAINPGAVVPIHTEGAARFGRHFRNAVQHDDGEWWAA